MAWNVRCGHGSFLTMEFGQPHIAVREPVVASPGRSDRVRRDTAAAAFSSSATGISGYNIRTGKFPLPAILLTIETPTSGRTNVYWTWKGSGSFRSSPAPWRMRGHLRSISAAHWKSGRRPNTRRATTCGVSSAGTTILQPCAATEHLYSKNPNNGEIVGNPKSDEKIAPNQNPALRSPVSIHAATTPLRRAAPAAAG